MDKKKVINIIVIGIFVIGIIIVTNVNKESKANSSSLSSMAAAGTEEIKGPWYKVGEEAVVLDDNLLRKNYYIIFDGSGSMEENNKIETAKKALNEFVTHVPEEANLGLAIFDGKGLYERVPLGGNRIAFRNQINSTVASGTTPLKDALTLAYSKLVEQAQKQLGYGEFNIVVVTDGEASSGQSPDKIVRLILAQTPITIYTIGFNIGEDHSLNQPGKIIYKTASNFEELSKGLEDVLAESESFIVTKF